MSIWGKILGGAAGFALGGPLGALIGGIAGHVYDTRKAAELAEAEAAGGGGAHAAGGPDPTKQIGFTIAVIALGAKLAKADGVVTKDEVAAFRQVFQVPPGEVRNVARVFDMARKSAAGYQPYARQIAGMFAENPAVLEELLDCLFHIAKADGRVSDEEAEYIANVARIFGFTEAEFARIRAENLGADAADPYAVLGVAHDASDDEVRRAWHALVRENHPDRLIAQGMPEEFVAIANDKLAAINAAWDRVSQMRGLN